MMPILIKTANKWRIYDLPSDRKVHSAGISALGGIGIFFGIRMGLFSSLLFVAEPTLHKSSTYLLVGMLLIFLNGLGDDLFSYSANKKFFLQFVICFLFVDSDGIFQQELHRLVGSYYATRFILTLALVTIINSINLMDGIDGLAATMGIFICTVFSFLNILHENIFLSVLSLSTIGALGGFFYFNRNPAKIFMGDSGALMLGFVIAFLTISTPYKSQTYFLSHTKLHVVNIILATISLPVFDVIRLFFSRLVFGASPFKGDRNHLHHILVDSGVSVVKSVVVILGIAVLQVIIAVCLPFETWYGVLSILMVSYWVMFKLISYSYYGLKSKVIDCQQQTFISISKEKSKSEF
jgi:UDP-N-acetylmuramyl pentapeptide phosphotransferase/UDP-N-acetylglucosamine-1-phosphate transferase